MQACLAITYHSVELDGSITTELLYLKHLPGENIFHAFQNLLNDFSVLLENTVAICMNNAFNNTSIYRLFLNHLD